MRQWDNATARHDYATNPIQTVQNYATRRHDAAMRRQDATMRWHDATMRRRQRKWLGTQATMPHMRRVNGSNGIHSK